MLPGALSGFIASRPRPSRPRVLVSAGGGLENGGHLLGERAGRSAALERAYVHDVYEQCEEPAGAVRPRVAQFLAGLEPGALVCDVGCGSGRYLNVGGSGVFMVGADRCSRLADVASSKGGQVAICDNLELPFRDETFDAVLSLAVVHHFATTERRVGAIRELARVLRIGGRLVISVWAMEQRHRRFESQDVLVPWRPPRQQTVTTSDEEGEDNEDVAPQYHACNDDSDSSRSAGGRRGRVRSSDPSPDSSSLSSSSPGETCYSFVRRAIQKLAGGKRSMSGRPWFVDTWGSRSVREEPVDAFEDARDLPIELRRLEDFEDIPEPPLSAGLKSRSLGDILAPPPRTMVRSRSSVPSLGNQINEPSPIETSPRRPKLVKQKQSLCEESEEEPDLRDLVRDLPVNIQTPSLRKQSSLNEELMSASRLREKDRVRRRIQKQTSLNEAFLCRSLFVGGAAKRLQVLREGLSTRIKTSTGSLERVTKNGLVRMLQGWKNKSTVTPQPPATTNTPAPSEPVASCTTNATPTLRRHSREDGSDSSKDSSLQSDTSVDSEDSFASVIFIPRNDSNSVNGDSQPPISPGPTSPRPKPPSSVPTSPLVKTTPPPPRLIPLAMETTLQAHIIIEEAQKQKSDDIGPIPKSEPKLLPKITRQIVKNLPHIPKYRNRSVPSPFPLVRRCSALPPARPPPRLLSLELFNPETDDLDSDSSEPSSPDSVDSVISALPEDPPASGNSLMTGTHVEFSEEAISKVEQTIRCSNETASDENEDMNLKADDKDDCRNHLVEFAEQLSAQLLKELNENTGTDEIELDHSDDPYLQRLNGELRDLSRLSRELRERQLLISSLDDNKTPDEPVLPRFYPPPLTTGPSIESWGHTASTASLESLCVDAPTAPTNKVVVTPPLDSSPDSPTGGGAATHHRYYHVFREGELDSLIGRHVASLHIVSSYYERASWCVVAEKVQVWTI